MSTRREKTNKRKEARWEDRDALNCVLERIEGLGDDPTCWDVLDLTEIRDKLLNIKDEQVRRNK